MDKTKTIRIIGINFITFFVILLIFELLIEFFLNNPPSNLLLLKSIANYYMEYDRKIIQFIPQCAKYDSNLFYTLNPGISKFENREYNVEMNINSLGVRDDENSLFSPDIIILGDSHTMGWGVKNEDIYVSLLEKKLNKKILNLAVSSYGTVRQLKLLQRLGNIKYDWLIIQYANNDFRENKEYMDNCNRLIVRKQIEYNYYVDYLEKKQTIL